MKVISFTPQSTLPKDTAEALRALADMAENGSLTDLIVCGVIHGEYSFYEFSSLSNSLVLSQLYNQWILEKFRA